MSEKTEMEKWIEQYIKDHKCRHCDGTGSVPSDDPYEPNNDLVCDWCGDTGVYPKPEKPTADGLYNDMKKQFNMEGINKIKLDHERKLALCTVHWGKYRYYEKRLER